MFLEIMLNKIQSSKSTQLNKKTFNGVNPKSQKFQVHSYFLS